MLAYELGRHVYGVSSQSFAGLRAGGDINMGVLRLGVQSVGRVGAPRRRRHGPSAMGQGAGRQLLARGRNAKCVRLGSWLGG